MVASLVANNPSAACPVADWSSSLSELINEHSRSVIQIIERMLLTIIVNLRHQCFSVFSPRYVPLGLGYSRHDKSPTSTNSEGAPSSSQQLNSQRGQNAACP